MPMPEGLQLKQRYAAWKAGVGKNPFAGLALSISVAVIVLDQLTKQWVLHFSGMADGLCAPENPRYCGHIELSPVFDLSMVWNRGVSFGLFAGGWPSRIGLSVLSLSVSAALIYWLATLNRRVAVIGVGLIIGGALGNSWDRMVYGAVVDFLDFSGLWFPWVFNVADAAINVGVACLLYDAFFAAPKQDKVKAGQDDA